ncbi:hypothetical protein [Streptomyces sp. MUSC 14]|uniref:hypothetical protein n=1 Tax=Streptomyces sp. MUSC 14 TaxID=1354889 RepID=UPI00210CACA6|nr:hypothetical protein [Streptomyces sp. MUSC 14]
MIENLDATTEVLTALDTIVGDPAAELATNTSALPVRRTVRGRCRVRAVLRMKEAPCPPKITNGVTDGDQRPGKGLLNRSLARQVSPHVSEGGIEGRSAQHQVIPWGLLRIF